MKSVNNLLIPQTGQILAVCVLSASLAACGGSSGGNTTDTTDTDIQGIGNLDPDSDLDGLTDSEEITRGTFSDQFDSDGDGLGDGEEVNTYGTDPLLADTDGDGLSDGYEVTTSLSSPTNSFDTGGEVVDTIDATDNGDGTDNGTDTGPNDAECADSTSSNDFWGDNCTVQQFGTYARSSYAKGIQRILWCQGHGQGVNDIEAFSDGIFGPNTGQAVRDFQTANSLTVDGVVGVNTWNTLREKLPAPVQFSSALFPFDSLTVEGCENDVLFYQRVDGFIGLDWMMATTPNSTAMIPFSSDPVQ